MDIRFSNAKGVPAYHAVVVKGGQVQFFQIAERSKNVIELDASSRPVWMLGWRSKADVRYTKAAAVSLSSAHTHGPAIKQWSTGGSRRHRPQRQ